VHAVILIGKNIKPLPYDKTLERPVAVADTKLPRAGISELIEAAY
jgi:hypothetical protein